MLAATALAILLPACGDPPRPAALPGAPETRSAVSRSFVDAQPAAVTVIPVSRNAFRPVSMEAPLPDSLADRPLDLRFPSDARLSDLISVLGSLDIPVVINRDAGMTAALGAELPFTSWRGSLGELLEVLRRSSSVISSWRGNVIQFGTLARYSVDLPQNAQIMSTIAGEIQSLGATEIVQSVTGGKLMYQARPDDHDTVIAPFLERVSDNLAMVSMQVAVVSLAMNDSTSQGFDWNAFRLNVDGRARSSGTTGGEGGVPALGSVGGTEFRRGTVLDATSTAISVAQGGSGSVFGMAATFTVGAALNILSTFGETEITQNVELKTIAGQEVSFRSGQEVPFVSGVSTTATGDNTTGAAETSTVQTGLTVTLNPFYDSGTGLVTLELDLEQRQILQFVELSAGTGVGTLTQPLTQDQRLTDLIRLPVGQTIVVGGLQNDNFSMTGSEPSILRRALPESAQFGNRTRNLSRNSFFIVVRPTVTVFERRGDAG